MQIKCNGDAEFGPELAHFVIHSSKNQDDDSEYAVAISGNVRIEKVAVGEFDGFGKVLDKILG